MQSHVMKTILLQIQTLEPYPNDPMVSGTLQMVGTHVQELLSQIQRLEDEVRASQLETIELKASKLRLERSIKYDVERERKEDRIRIALLQRIVTWDIEVVRTGSSMSVLHEACMYGLLDIVEILVAKQHPLGVLDEVRGGWGNCATPIHLAIYHGHQHVVEYLHRQDDTLIHRLTPATSSVELAALAGPEMLTLVLDLLKSSGSDESEHMHGYYAVAACATGDTSLLEQHLEFVPDDFSISGGMKLNHVAAQYLQLDVLKCLAEKKRNLFEISHEGCNVFHMASFAFPRHFLHNHRLQWQQTKGNLFEFDEEAESNRRILEVICWLVGKAHLVDFGGTVKRIESQVNPTGRKLFQLYSMDAYQSCVIRGTAYSNSIEACMTLYDMLSRIFNKCEEQKNKLEESATIDVESAEYRELDAVHAALGKLLQNVKATIIPYAWKSKRLLQWFKTGVQADMSVLDMWSRTAAHHAAGAGAIDEEFLDIIELTQEQAERKDWASMSVADLAVLFGGHHQIDLLLKKQLAEPSVALAGRAAYFGHRHLLPRLSPPSTDIYYSSIVIEHLKNEDETIFEKKPPGPSWWKVLKKVPELDDKNRETALKIAATVGNTKWLKRARLNEPRIVVMLHEIAVLAGQWSFFLSLPHESPKRSGIWAKFSRQWSAISIDLLWLAAAAGHFAIFVKLFGIVENENMRTSAAGLNVMHYAALGGNYRIVKWLLNNNFNDLINHVPGKASPLHMAAYQRDVRVVKLVSPLNTTYSILDQDNRTPAHYAAEKGSLSVLTFLKSKGEAGFAIADKNGRLPVHLAALHGHHLALPLFLSLDYMWNQDNNGNNIAHLAFLGGHPEVIKWISTTVGDDRPDWKELPLNNNGISPKDYQTMRELLMALAELSPKSDFSQRISKNYPTNLMILSLEIPKVQKALQSMNSFRSISQL